MRVLLVDDEPAVLRALARLITRIRPGDEVVGVSDGQAALETLSRPFDLLLTDLHLPGMDGATLVGRARDLQPATVCLILTGDCKTDQDRPGCADGYLEKPCAVEELRAALERAERLAAERSANRPAPANLADPGDRGHRAVRGDQGVAA